MNAQLRKHFSKLGKKGGKACATKLTKAQRHERAVKAGNANKKRLAAKKSLT